MGDPQSVDEWLALARQHEDAARILASDRGACGQALFHCGLGVECAIKAYIMHVERLNRWPDRSTRDELYDHDIRRLARIAGITFKATAREAPSWHVMTQWDRNQAYNPKRTPRKVARAYVDAAFGSEGVATWIRRSLRPHS